MNTDPSWVIQNFSVSEDEAKMFKLGLLEIIFDSEEQETENNPV